MRSRSRLTNRFYAMCRYICATTQHTIFDIFCSLLTEERSEAPSSTHSRWKRVFSVCVCVCVKLKNEKIKKKKKTQRERRRRKKNKVKEKKKVIDYQMVNCQFIHGRRSTKKRPDQDKDNGSFVLRIVFLLFFCAHELDKDIKNKGGQCQFEKHADHEESKWFWANESRRRRFQLNSSNQNEAKQNCKILRE